MASQTAFLSPLYVVQIKPFLLWSVKPKETAFEVLVKIRYNMQAVKANITINEQNSIKVEFEQPVSAITPGQACVFYELNEGYLLGGGFIKT